MEQWAASAVVPVELGVRCLSQGSHLMDNSCRSRDSNPQSRVTSPTLYPLEPQLPHLMGKQRMLFCVSCELLNTIFFCFLCIQRVFSYLCKITVEPLMSHRLFYRSPCYISGCWSCKLHCCLWEGQRALRMHQKQGRGGKVFRGCWGGGG